MTPIEEELRAWLKAVVLNPERCFLCHQIWLRNRDRLGAIGPIELDGIRLTTEMQISHLVHCMKKKGQTG